MSVDAVIWFALGVMVLAGALMMAVAWACRPTKDDPEEERHG